MPLPPELIVTVEKVSADPQDDQFLAVTSRSNGAEVCRNLFHFRPDLLVDLEPQWMLEKAVPRHAGEAIKRGAGRRQRSEDRRQKLAELRPAALRLAVRRRREACGVPGVQRRLPQPGPADPGAARQRRGAVAAAVGISARWRRTSWR